MYKLFVDDSWSKDYINIYSEDLKNNLPEWNDDNLAWLDSNFFALCWIHIKNEYIKDIDLEIKELKEKYFKRKDIEIKSTYLRNSKNRKKYYLDKYNIKNEDINNFWEDIYKILEKHKDKFLIFWVVFDKRHFKYRDSDKANILLKSAQVLFERIEMSGYKTKIIFDQMDKSLVKSKWNNWKLFQVYKWENKKIIWYFDEYKNIIDIEFQRSDKENMLQIADLISYNIRRQFMENWKILIEWGTEKCKLYKYFSKTAKNIYSSKKWKIMWYWLVLYPNWNKIDWRIKKFHLK